MAYKDRMIASRSIAAAVREARVEMKKLGEGAKAKGASAARGSHSSLPAPHRRGVPTSARLREAVRRDLKSLEKTAGKVRAKANGVRGKGATPDELIDTIRGIAETLKEAQAELLEQAITWLGAGDTEQAASWLSKAQSILSRTRDYMGQADEIQAVIDQIDAGVDIQPEGMDERSAHGVRSKANGDSPQVLMDMIEAVIESAEGAPGLPDDVLEALGRLSYDQDPIDLENDLATIVEACRDFAGERTNFGTGPFGGIERAAQKALDYVREGGDGDKRASARSGVRSKGGVTLDELLEELDAWRNRLDSLETDEGMEIVQHIDALYRALEADDGDEVAVARQDMITVAGGSSTWARIEDLLNEYAPMAGYPFGADAASGRFEQSAGDSVARKGSGGGTVKLELDGVSTSDIEDLISEYGGEITGVAGGSVGVCTVHFDDVSYMQDFVDAIGTDSESSGVTVVDVQDEKGSPSSTRTKKSELDGALADIQYDVAQINRVVDAEDDGSAEMEAWKAAYNTWVSTAESATDEDPTEGLPDALDALVEAATDLQGHYIDQDMVDSLMSAIDSYNSIVTRSASDVTTKASSLSDVEERLGARGLVTKSTWAERVIEKLEYALSEFSSFTDEDGYDDAKDYLESMLEAAESGDKRSFSTDLDAFYDDVVAKYGEAEDNAGTFSAEVFWLYSALVKALYNERGLGGTEALRPKYGATMNTDPNEFVDRLNGARKGTSRADTTTKASSLSDVEERLGAAMNAMGKAASAADKAGAETEDPDEADAASALSELCSDIAGDLQATDADDRDGIQGLMDQITEIEITIRDEAAAEQVGTFTEKARAALEEALELLSAYEGKSATGSKSSTRTKGDALDAAIAAAVAELERDLSPDASPPLDEETARDVQAALDANESGSLDEFIEALLDAGYDHLAQAIEDADAEDDAEGKGATRSKSSTRTKATDPTEFVDRLNGAREGLNTLLEGSEDIHETDAINQALDMVDQAMTAAGDENWDGAADLLSDAASYLDGVIGSESTAEALNAFAEEARGVSGEIKGDASGTRTKGDALENLRSVLDDMIASYSDSDTRDELEQWAEGLPWDDGEAVVSAIEERFGDEADPEVYLAMDAVRNE